MTKLLKQFSCNNTGPLNELTDQKKKNKLIKNKETNYILFIQHLFHSAMKPK